MRSLTTKLLAVAVVALLVSPALAQRQPGRGQGQGGRLLLNPKVQDDLKLSDEQKAELQKAQKSLNAAFQKARDAGDREKAGEIIRPAMEKVNKTTEGVLKDLKADQKKRLGQIQLQAAGLFAFAIPQVQEKLNLTDDQKKEIQAIGREAREKGQELFQDAQGDREKMAAAMKKMATVNKDAMAKVMKTLKDDQKKTWREMTGKPIDVQGMGFGFGGGRPPRKRDQ